MNRYRRREDQNLSFQGFNLQSYNMRVCLSGYGSENVHFLRLPLKVVGRRASDGSGKRFGTHSANVSPLNDGEQLFYGRCFAPPSRRQGHGEIKKPNDAG